MATSFRGSRSPRNPRAPAGRRDPVRRHRARTGGEARPGRRLSAGDRSSVRVRRKARGREDRRARASCRAGSSRRAGSSETPGPRGRRRGRLRRRFRWSPPRGLSAMPTVIHESNAFPGVANRFLEPVRHADGRRNRGGELPPPEPGVVTGTPVRPEFFGIPRSTRREDPAPPRLRRQPGLARPRIAAMAARRRCSRQTTGLEVIHQTGEKEFEGPAQGYCELPGEWRLVPFLPRIHEELAWADLVLCRAGSQTLAELAAAGTPVDPGALRVAAPRPPAGERAGLLDGRGGRGHRRRRRSTGESPRRTPSPSSFGDRGPAGRDGRQGARVRPRPDAAKELAELRLRGGREPR